jgi:hypothetical protein
MIASCLVRYLVHDASTWFSARSKMSKLRSRRPP